jgi:hypothetical protein
VERHQFRGPPEWLRRPGAGASPISQDQTSSVYLYSQAWVLYHDKNFIFPLLCVFPDHFVPDLRSYAANDTITSLRRTGSASCPVGIPTA